MNKIASIRYQNQDEICFKVDEVDYTSTLSEEDIKKYCLTNGEIIPVVYKN